MDMLQAIQGVGPVTADKLQQAGYESYAQIAAATAAELNERIGLPQSTTEKIIVAAKALAGSEPVDVETSEAAEPTETADLPREVDKRQLTKRLVNRVAQSSDIIRQIAQEISVELARLPGKRLRKQLAKKALSTKKFRKTLISSVVKELKKM